MTNYSKTLLQITAAYCKLRQCVITNCGKMLLQITANVITNYGNFITNYGNVLLQVTAALSNYYKLRQLFGLLQITTGITFYGVITNYVVPHIPQ